MIAIGKLGLPKIDELKYSAVAVKKSGISIGQYVKGYGMAQLMKNLGDG